MQGKAPLSDLTSEDLACRAGAGSESSFSELVRRHGPSLFLDLRRRIPNAHDAEDLTQETFIKARRNLGRYDARYPFAVWLHTIGRRLVYSFLRRRAPVHVPLTEAAGVATAEASSEGDLWGLADRVLPKSQRDALWLRYGEGLSVADIARETGRSRVHVKVLLHRGRTRLARTIRAGDREGGAS
jgi:RNA polymerase sigma-70 factor (ECF subfamily)